MARQLIKTPEFAEFYGVLLGDGNLHTHGNQIAITEHPINDLEYYETYLIPLIRSLFGRKVNLLRHEDAIRIKFSFKRLKEILVALKFPIGLKARKLTIPNEFVESKELMKYVTKGMFDTDGSLYFETDRKYEKYTYPRLRIKIVECEAMEILNSFLKKTGFKTYKDLEIPEFPHNNLARIRISGAKMLDKWNKLIGFSNSYHLTKFMIWKKYGFCPPKLNILQLKEFYHRGCSTAWPSTSSVTREPAPV